LQKVSQFENFRAKSALKSYNERNGGFLMMNNFLFIGGDMRQVHAARRLGRHYDCFIYGFDEPLPPAGISALREISKFKSLVLPLPATTDGVHINAPYFKQKIPLSVITEGVNAGGTVFCGRICPALEKICAENNLTLVDYFDREELAVMNAVPTAEGCLEIVLRESDYTIFGAAVLLTGYGRITKVLVKYLTALGARVTVAARKYSDLAWAEIMGCQAVLLAGLDDSLGKFDVIINTVPVQIFDAEQTRRFKPDCLVVDLASKAGFEDMAGVIHALSLPGKVAPITAGNIIAETIMNILTESGLNA
jgi:dipicolinate synthase subunit A